MPTITLPPLGSPPTDTELRLLWLRAHGHTNRAAGRLEHIAENTVKTHLRRLFARLGVHTTTEAVRVCYQRQLPPFEVPAVRQLNEFIGLNCCQDPAGAVINQLAAAERDLAELRAQQAAPAPAPVPAPKPKTFLEDWR